jgi:hypothetical protein
MAARVTWILMLSPAIAIGCTTVDSPTDLDPEGPPMVRQVFVMETTRNCPPPMPADCPSFITTQPPGALAYGTHPDAVHDDLKHPVLHASPASSTGIRVVMDELLIGNYLEEIACNALVDNDQYSAVPVGATPEDIAKCAVKPDLLVQTCTGEFAVCIGPNGPVGVLDQIPIGGDGASDDTQFIDGAVGIRCGSITPALDLQLSFWQPSGNQQPPAQGGLALLGPAVVLNAIHGLPTSQVCTIVFSDAVTDKTNNTVCAPKWGPDGAPTEDYRWPPLDANDAPVECIAGDTSDIAFTVDELRVVGGVPENGTGVPRVKSGETFAELKLTFNAQIDQASFANATLTPAAGAITANPTTPPDNKSVAIQVAGGLAAQTDYTLTIPTPKDYYGIPMPTALVRHFRTGN